MMMMQQQQLQRSARASNAAPASSSRRASVSVVARATKTKTVAAEPVAAKKKGPGFLSQTISALDFVEASRSKKDADLLYEAKYGQLKDGKMTPEQYAALRRKVGGTAKGFFKEWVEEDVTPAYMKESAPGAQVPFLPLLVGVAVALVGVTVVVVEKTA